MMDAECVVLYTHQKLKKAKTWHDGVLKILTPGTRAILYDDKKTKIDTVHIKPEAIVSGEQLESDRHLILIEEIKTGVNHGQVPMSSGQTGGREQHVVQARPHVPVLNNAVGTGGRLSIRAGIKRRKTGFVPPRMIKQPRLDLDEGRTDSFESGYNNPIGRSNPTVYTHNTQSNPDTVSILNLYNRTGAKATDSTPSNRQSTESAYASSNLQSNTEPLVATPPDQKTSLRCPSPLLGRLTCDEAPGTVPQPSSPWTSFGEGRLKHTGGDSPRNVGRGTNDQILYGTKSNNQQNVIFNSNVYTASTNFRDRNKNMSESSQDSCNKNVSGFASNACTGTAFNEDSQRTASKLHIADPSPGHNTAMKRSASQIMALLGKSRNKDPIQTEHRSQSESQCTDISKDSSVLPVSSPLECPIDNTGHRDHTVTGIGLSASAKEISLQNNLTFVDSQHEGGVRTSYHGELNDSSSEFDFALSSSPPGPRHKQPDHLGQQAEFEAHTKQPEFEAHTKQEQCNSEGDGWEKQRDAGKHIGMEKISQEHVVPVQDNINGEATLESFHESDLFSQEKTEEGIVFEHKIEQYCCRDSLPGTCSNEDVGSENDQAAGYECDENDNPDALSSDDEVDEIDVVQQGSFLISFSPLSQVSNSDEDCVQSSHNTDVDPKLPLSQVSNSDKNDVQSSHNTDVDPKQKTTEEEDSGTQEDQVVEEKEEWIDKTENPGKICSVETNIQLTGSSDSNSTQLKNYQTTDDNDASQVPKTEECVHNPQASVVCNSSVDQFNSLNDLNFSPDSVTFASLSSVEGREENNKSTVRSWQTTQKVPGSCLVTDIPKLAVLSPKSTNQEFSKMNVSSLHPTSENIVLHPDIMRDITNITPDSSGKLLQWNELKPMKFETTPRHFTQSDVLESELEGFEKSHSLSSSGDFSSQYKEVAMLQGSEESASQTESVPTKLGRNTPPMGFVNTKCHASENSWGRILPGTGMPYHYDTIPVRTTQEQHTFAESMRSTPYTKPSAIVENCNLTEEPLPHPSQFLRRPSVTSHTTATTITPIDTEDPFTDRADPEPIENATQRLQQYKVRGSVSGGVARRASKADYHHTRSPSLSVAGLDYHHTRSPSLSAMEDQRAKETLYSSMSASQTLENTSFLPDQDDHSLFIDWNVGKPHLVDITTLCNAQDIKIPGSPYQHVPTARESPQTYEGGCEEGNVINVPDIDFGRRNLSTSHCFSVKSGAGVFATGCDLQDVPSESIRLLCAAESPTFGNMFKEKRNMINCDPDSKLKKFCSNLDKSVVEKPCKEKVSLKCKPFEDSFTHTSYTSSYFSPTSVDFGGQKDIPASLDLRGQRDIPANVDLRGQKDIPASVDFRGQKDIPASVDSKVQTDTTQYVKHKYMDRQLDVLGVDINDNNRELSVRDECSLEKKSDLHLSLSSVGSSDLELSFTLTDYYQGQSKPHVDPPRESQLCTAGNAETRDLRSSDTSDFKSTCEDSVPSGANECNDSKWGKFIMKEDQGDDLIFDGSFDEQYNTKKLENRMCFKNVPSQCTSVNEPCRMTADSSGQLQWCNDTNNDSYHKSSLNTSNHLSSKNLSLCSQKPYMGTHNMQKHTLSPLTSTNQMLNPAIPHTGSTDVSSTMAEMENEISHDFLMDDFDLQDTEDMIVGSRFSKQNSAKSVSAAMTRVAEHDVIPSTSSLMITRNISTAVSTNHVFPPRQNTTKNSPSHILTPVAECDVLPPRKNKMKKFQSPVPSAGLVTHVMKGSKRSISGELQFASKEEVDSNPLPLRELSISVNFPTVAVYKHVLTAVLKEHLNIILFGQAQKYHQTLGIVDISNYIPAHYSGPLVNKSASMNHASTNPSCQCGVPSKMIQVKKAGSNKGRFFYACNSPRNKQCKYFQWVDQTGGGRTSTSGSIKPKLCEASSINTYMRGNHLMFYCECELLRKTASFCRNWVKMKYEQTNQDKKKLYIKLSKKDASSLYSKAFCHALLAGNISSELCYMSNLEDNVSPMSLPILPWILDSAKAGLRESSQQGGFKAPVRTAVSESNIFATKTSIMELAEEFIQRYSLNRDQGSALMRVCYMFCGNEEGPNTDPVLLIHGVFGAGKSFLLSVIVLFLVRLFEISDSYTPGVPHPWKVLISSTTNVAVDRILLSLLNIGFEDFVRVGSMKKISKPVLPFSVHATGSETQELKDLQEMLKSGELTPSEKHNVRQSIEKHRLGENKKRLSKVRVVGVTCASCTASSLDRMTFPVVLLDESSQMTEPASMLPIAKFGCEKLLLVGDPKQLDPTIQGSEAAHSNGLEQTLFDRLMKMGHTPTVLHTQYRCHPVISNLANTLFYAGQLIDGVSTSDRQPLVPDIPTLCFYDVSDGQEQADDGGSFYNEQEAVFVTSLIQALLVRGVEPASIGIITLYKSQMYKITTSILTNVKGDKDIKATRVSTVDAFQGGEHDVIILSCVRTKGVGFIDNHKRTNVALTRARHHLLIAGNKRNLSRNQLWGEVLQLCGCQPGGVCEADTFLRQLGNTDRGLSQDQRGSTPCSPPMSLSSQETNSVACSPQQDENDVTGPESSPLAPPTGPVVSRSVRRKCRVINANLLECAEASDSDEELPSL